MRLQDLAASLKPSGLAGVALIGGLWGTDDAPISDGSGALRGVARISQTAQQLTELARRLFCTQGESQP